MAERKTHTSTAVKRRYNDKTYSRIVVDLPKDLVAEFKEAVKLNGDSIAAIVRVTVEEYLEKNSKK